MKLLWTENFMCKSFPLLIPTGHYWANQGTPKNKRLCPEHYSSSGNSCDSSFLFLQSWPFPAGVQQGRGHLLLGDTAPRAAAIPAWAIPAQPSEPPPGSFLWVWSWIYKHRHRWATWQHKPGGCCSSFLTSRRKPGKYIEGRVRETNIWDIGASDPGCWKGERSEWRKLTFTLHRELSSQFPARMFTFVWIWSWVCSWDSHEGSVTQQGTLTEGKLSSASPGAARKRRQEEIPPAAQSLWKATGNSYCSYL